MCLCEQIGGRGRGILDFCLKNEIPLIMTYIKLLHVINQIPFKQTAYYSTVVDMYLREIGVTV